MKVEASAIDKLVQDLRALPTGATAIEPPPPPPLPPGRDGDRSEPMKADWEPRVNRLELGFCAGMVLIFSAIIASYLMLAGKLEGARDRIENIEVSQVRLESKADASGHKLDAISARLERK